MKTYTFVKNYREDDQKRLSFDDLSKKTFDLSFEDWYQNGFWGESYIPYSMFYGKEAAANVSVNTLDFLCDGVPKKLIQLGTVMTEAAHRNKGLIRELLSYVLRDYKEAADGIYLFANDSVLDFYPKFGFEKAKEYQYSKEISASKGKTIMPVSMKTSADWNTFLLKIQEYKSISSLAADNSGILMFYLTKFMSDNVYYSIEQDAYIIAQMEDDQLLIHDILARDEVCIDQIAQSFGQKIHRIVLGFTPLNSVGFYKEELKEEDTTLFILGENLQKIMNTDKMFPVLSHA